MFLVCRMIHYVSFKIALDPFVCYSCVLRDCFRHVLYASFF